MAFSKRLLSTWRMRRGSAQTRGTMATFNMETRTWSRLWQWSWAGLYERLKTPVSPAIESFSIPASVLAKDLSRTSSCSVALENLSAVRNSRIFQCWLALHARA